MTIDHVGHWLLDDAPWARIIGRIAMPLFCMLVAYGVTKSRNPWKFALRLFVFALAVQIFLNLYWYRNIFAQGWYNVFFTLSLGVLAASLLKICIKMMKSDINLRRVLCVVATIFGAIAVAAVPIIIDSVLDIQIDYGMPGVLLVVMFYLAVQHSMKALKITAGISIAVMCLLMGIWIQWFALLALPFIFVFVDRKLKISVVEKYAFYLFYPLHMVVIFLIQMWFF